MSRRSAERRRRRQALQELYASLPDVACQGLCQQSCSSQIDVSDLERDLLQASSGVRLPEWDQWPTGASCPLLTSSGACGDHANRPAICRLYGAGARLLEVMLRSFEIGGHREYAGRIETMRAMIADPRLHPAILRLLTGHTSPRQEFNRARHRRFSR
ncbi:YkgJ family cysteine cluster protein [Nonomuraea sp. AD125B]|uniref:YkgJ family cysteine cluster protein n=1 Tax=Nonomuraea sp. AD125B TaxID=3242897 RepID=UPI0035272FC3